MDLKQIFDIINLGIVIIDHEYVVREWNLWMELNSGIFRSDIINTGIFTHYPNLNTQGFVRGCKTVFTFGSFVFLSQKLHGRLFPFLLSGSQAKEFEYMQQSCTMAPVMGENNKVSMIMITVQDVTENVIIEKKLRKINLLDGLTGIYNRRHFDVRMQEEFFRHKRYGRPMSIIMLDIDNFKLINDTYGHQAGDSVLRELSAICSGVMRKVDILARYGGEEFCCIMPETEIVGAIAMGERLRRRIGDHLFMDEGISIQVTASIGVAELDEGIETPEKMVRAADKALYKAKNDGRNRVIGISKDLFIMDIDGSR